MDLSYTVAQRVQLEDVHIARAVMKRAADIQHPARIELSFAVAPELEQADNRLRITITFRLQERVGTGERAERGLSIETVYVLCYRLSSDESLSPAHLDAFAEMNGVYNAWPYWREFVQNATIRMGLPGLTIPVLPPITRQNSGPMPAVVGDAGRVGKQL